MTTGEMAKAPALFLRNATGLVKGWSGFDAFAYSFMSVNLVTLGMFYSLAVFAYVPKANPLLWARYYAWRAEACSRSPPCSGVTTMAI